MYHTQNQYTGTWLPIQSFLVQTYSPSLNVGLHIILDFSCQPLEDLARDYSSSSSLSLHPAKGFYVCMREPLLVILVLTLFI